MWQHAATYPHNIREQYLDSIMHGATIKVKENFTFVYYCIAKV